MSGIQSYEDLIQKMILNWRAHWKQEELPFIVIQLPACGMDNRGDGAWAVIREAQKMQQNFRMWQLL